HEDAYWRVEEEPDQGYGPHIPFRTRLRDSQGEIIRGYGKRTLQELREHGLVEIRDCERTETRPREYGLSEKGRKTMKDDMQVLPVYKAGAEGAKYCNDCKHRSVTLPFCTAFNWAHNRHESPTCEYARSNEMLCAPHGRYFEKAMP
ncbi:MAG: hypothetical protein P8Y47_11380, partial [Alphaproteobacteria bacterium]